MKKYMKFAGLLFVLVFPVAVNAGDFLYTTNSGTITITGYTGSGGDVVIPDTINDLPVTRIGYRAFYNRTSLTGITMPVGLTNIDYEAFANCSGLTGITLPAALTGIGYYAFDNCRGLKGGLMIPSGVTNIGYRAFRNCSGLTGSLTLPVALTGIGCEAFYNCYGLTGGLTIPAGVTYIGLYEYFDMYASYDAFFGCSALTSITVDGLNTNYSSVDGVLYNKEQTMLLRCLEGRTGSLTIPAGVTSIETIACVNCSKLTGNLTIPAGVTNIGNGAFYNCSGLTGNLTIPASASMRYPSQVFYNCIGLTSITVDALSTNYSSFDGVLYNKAQTSLLLCPLGKTSDLFVPDSVTNIPLQQEYGDSYRFYLSQCGALTSITVDSLNTNYSSSGGVLYNKAQTSLLLCPRGKTGSLTLPAGVTVIESNAFNNCSGLTGGLTIPAGVTNIRSYAFYKCSGLTGNLTLPAGVTRIDEQAFNFCPGLTGSLTIPAGVKTINDSVFANTGLTSVTIPTNVTSIGSSAFDRCSGLTAITVDALNSYYSSTDGVLYNKAQTQLIQCPGGKTGAFVVPDSVTSISASGFSDCDGLTSVTIPAGVTSIGDMTFDNCDRATIIVDGLSSNYCSVDGVLYNKNQTRLIRCSGSKSGDLFISSSVNDIWKYAFHFCPDLTSITVDDLNPAYSSFDGVLYNKTKTQLIQCPGGKTGGAVVPASVTNTSGVEAFKFCFKLTSITVDDLNSVYSSVDGVFYNKAKTQLIAYPAGRTGGLVIPNSVTSIEGSALRGCSGLTSVAIPAGVTFIGSFAFRECAGLTGVYFHGSAPRLDGLSFYDSPVTIYRLAGATGWPAVPNLWSGRPTALWEPDSDEDADGIPAVWELQYFGGTTNAIPNAVCSNGINSVLEAYIAGLNPNDPQSVFLASVSSSPTSGGILNWNAVTGRVYSVYWTTNLMSGFQCLESNIPWTQSSFTNGSAGPCEYYKLKVQLAP